MVNVFHQNEGTNQKGEMLDSGKGNARNPQGVGGGRFLDHRNVPRLQSNQSKLEQDWGLQE